MPGSPGRCNGALPAAPHNWQVGGEASGSVKHDTQNLSSINLAMSTWPKDGSLEGVDRDAFDEQGPLLGGTEVAQPDPELDLRAGSLREEIIRLATHFPCRCFISDWQLYDWLA